MKIRKDSHIKRKAKTLFLFKEDGKTVSTITFIKYNVNTGNIYVFGGLVYSKRIICSKCYEKRSHKSLCKEGTKCVSDDEIKSNVRKIMELNPLIRVKEIAEKTGYSLYRLSRIYMQLRRRIVMSNKKIII